MIGTGVSTQDMKARMSVVLAIKTEGPALPRVTTCSRSALDFNRGRSYM